jgi:putative transposase
MAQSSQRIQPLQNPGRFTREDARADVFDYIERFYNPLRKHSKLNFLSPIQFESLKG